MWGRESQVTGHDFRARHGPMKQLQSTLSPTYPFKFTPRTCSTRERYMFQVTCTSIKNSGPAFDLHDRPQLPRSTRIKNLPPSHNPHSLALQLQLPMWQVLNPPLPIPCQSLAIPAYFPWEGGLAFATNSFSDQNSPPGGLGYTIKDTHDCMVSVPQKQSLKGWGATSYYCTRNCQHFALQFASLHLALGLTSLSIG